MTFEEFEAQVTSVKGDPYLEPAARLLYESNAIGGEAAEVFEAVSGLLITAGHLQNTVKKNIRDDTPLAQNLLDEHGDMLFYMKRLLNCCGFTLEDAAEALLAKLERMRQDKALSDRREALERAGRRL
jgi:NTP pyrophosphatase (non-canonical NTP hydrolase)